MERIILIGHGSPRPEANNLEEIAQMVHSIIHPQCRDLCVRVAYLQFGRPALREVIDESVNEGVKRLIIHPFFLFEGLHVKRDIPEIIERAMLNYPDVEFLYTEPLGFNEWTAKLIIERIRDVLPVKDFPYENLSSQERIEEASFKIISERLGISDTTQPEKEILMRVIHATADFEFKDTLLFHPDAVKRGIEAIRAGKDIITDVEMVRAGIIKRWLEPFGGKVICNINDSDVSRLSEHTGKTRAEIAIEKALRENTNVGIIAIGNAPTALLKVIEILKNSSFIEEPFLVIGVPVGFVKALESKILLSMQSFPFITNLSRKGGSPVAVAIVNALLKIVKEERQ